MIRFTQQKSLLVEIPNLGTPQDLLSIIEAIDHAAGTIIANANGDLSSIDRDALFICSALTMALQPSREQINVQTIKFNIEKAS